MRVRVLATLAVLGVLTGCEGRAQFAPSLPSAAGYRADAGALDIWTGTPCEGITRATVTYDAGTEDRARLVLEAPGPGVTVEHLDPADPDPGFTVVEALPEGFDWAEAETVSLLLDGGEARWSSVVDVAEVVDGSPDHPRGSYLFDDVGWLDEEGVADGNGSTFLTVCTPDPEPG